MKRWYRDLRVVREEKMSLRIARFLSEEAEGKGVVFYDSTTMYVYPVRFADPDAAWRFNDWVERNTGSPVNNQPGDIYALYERYLDSLKAELGSALVLFGESDNFRLFVDGTGDILIQPKAEGAEKKLLRVSWNKQLHVLQYGMIPDNE